MRAMSMRQSIKRVLPKRVADRVRSLRDNLLIAFFAPKTVTHTYGSVSLQLRIADPCAAEWYDKDWHEPPEITFLKQKKLKPAARVFDIGSHQAVIAMMLAKIVGDAGTVVALEPGRFNFKVATANKALNAAENLVLINGAISERNGEIAFRDGLNGTISPCGYVAKCFTIDTLAQLYGWPDVVYLDVEGAEGLALQGAGATMGTDADWFVEVHSGCGLETTFGGSASEIVNAFRSTGHSLYVEHDGIFEPFAEVPEGRFFLIATRPD
jgi:FkbM family methyltransferase